MQTYLRGKGHIFCIGSSDRAFVLFTFSLFLLEALCFRLVVCNIEVQMSVSEERVICFRTGGSDCAICASFDVNLSFAVDNNWGSNLPPNH